MYLLKQSTDVSMLNVGILPSKRSWFYLPLSLSFKSDEKCFLFHVKSSFRFQNNLNFCPNFFGHVGKRLDQKGKVNFKISDVTDMETIAIHILPNISRGKGNQTMKFVQLIECNKYFSWKIIHKMWFGS